MTHNIVKIGKNVEIVVNRKNDEPKESAWQNIFATNTNLLAFAVVEWCTLKSNHCNIQ